MRYKMIKKSVAMVTTLMPETHYSRYLIEALIKKYKDALSLLVYSNKEEKVKGFRKISINKCWNQNFFYPFQILKQAIKDRVKIVHLQHEINMYGGSKTALLFPFLVLLLKLMEKKVVVTIHGVVPKKKIDLNFLRTFSWSGNKITVNLVKNVLSFIYTNTCFLSDIVIVHSKHIKSVLMSDYNAKEEKIRAIPHGVPGKRLPNKSKEINADWWEKIKNKKKILFFGYLVKRKGLEYLIDAFKEIAKKYKDYVLVLAGGMLQEDYVKKLKKIVKNKGLSKKVIFTSFIKKEEDLKKLILSSEFVVLPSIYSISASGPLAQVMSLHKPVIGTDIGTFSEEIDDGADGLLCSPKSAKSLKETMERLIENENLLNKLKNGIKKKAKKRSWVNIAERTYKIYRELGFRSGGNRL